MIEILGAVWAQVQANYGGVIAVLALVLTIYEAHSTRRHNRLSVRPIVDFVKVIDIESKGKALAFECVLTNKGLGPATFCDAKIVLDQGEEWDVLKVDAVENIKSALERIENSFSEPLGSVVHTKLIGDGVSLEVNERLCFLEVICDQYTDKTKQAVTEFFMSLEVIVKYKDLYGKTYICDRSA